MKKSHDYDNTFKTLKNKHAKLFISVINEAFNKCYPLDSKVQQMLIRLKYGRTIFFFASMMTIT